MKAKINYYYYYYLNILLFTVIMTNTSIHKILVLLRIQLGSAKLMKQNMEITNILH